MSETDLARQLILRLARLESEGGWSEGLNPAQRMALEYLARANQFSRQPSHVAEFMGSTRGTISQTLKALREKGLVAETRSQIDRRSLSYELTAKGEQAVASASSLGIALNTLPEKESHQLARTLQRTLESALDANGQKQFGICRKCHHHVPQRNGGFCKLLNLPITPSETERMCVEYAPVRNRT